MAGDIWDGLGFLDSGFDRTANAVGVRFMLSPGVVMASADRPVRVLVVDDEQAIADTLALILNRSGHECRAVYSAAEAVSAASTFRPNALVSDVLMPGMNGIELARYFAEHFTGCKVLLMSGYNSAIDIAQSFLPDGHFLHILTKPVLPQTVLAFVASCAGDQTAA